MITSMLYDRGQAKDVPFLAERFLAAYPVLLPQKLSKATKMGSQNLLNGKSFTTK